MKRKFLLSVLIICLAIVSVAAIAGLSGKWSGAFVGLDGNNYTLVYNFNVVGNKLTGTAEWPEGIVAIDDGRIDSTTLTFKLDFDGEIIPHTGKYYGDSIAMNIILNDKEMHFMLKPVK